MITLTYRTECIGAPIYDEQDYRENANDVLELVRGNNHQTNTYYYMYLLD